MLGAPTMTHVAGFTGAITAPSGVLPVELTRMERL
jgi:hypothetical protein